VIDENSNDYGQDRGDVMTNRNHSSDEDDLDMDDENENKKSIIIFLRSTFGLWLPIGVTCVFWLSLLPLKAYYRIIIIFLNDHFKQMIGNVCTYGLGGWDEETSGSDHYCYIDCSNQCEFDTAAACYAETLGDDTAWATLWITTVLTRSIQIYEKMQDYLMTAVWKNYLLGGFFKTHAHKKIHKVLLDRPKLIWFRLGRFLNIVKWVRFAFPLFRMILKLQDQVRTNYSTLQKARSSRSNREARIQRPSLLLKDLRRIESLHKVETTIAAWPSQCNMLLETLANEVSQYSANTSMNIRMATFYAEEFLRKSRERGRQITKQIQSLQEQLRRGVTEFSTSELYDRILRLSDDMSKSKRDFLVDHEDSDYGDGEEGKENDNSHRSQRRSDRSIKSRWYDFLHLEKLLSSRDYLMSPRSRFSVVWRITVTNCLVRDKIVFEGLTSMTLF
jgi:hypothetical protein